MAYRWLAHHWVHTQTQESSGMDSLQRIREVIALENLIAPLATQRTDRPILFIATRMEHRSTTSKKTILLLHPSTLEPECCTLYLAPSHQECMYFDIQLVPVYRHGQAIRVHIGQH